MNEIIHGDCLEVMPTLNIKFDMILCDLPYGTTQCKWDSVIPLDELWLLYKSKIKHNGVIVLTACEPFTSKLVTNGIDIFKYDMIWDKGNTTGFLNANKMPLRQHESILIFSPASNGNYTYNPQKRKGQLRKKGGYHNKKSDVYNDFKSYPKVNDIYHPTSIINVGVVYRNQNEHPTQKPLDLFKYLIMTYTNEGEIVLDNCSGSGTTAEACLETNRNYICIEKDKTYYDSSVERINNYKSQTNLFKVA